MTGKKLAFYLGKIHIFSTSLAHLASYHYCIFLEGMKTTQKYKLYIDKKTNQGHKISRMKCKFSVHYLVDNNYKLISKAALRRGPRGLRIIRILNLL